MKKLIITLVYLLIFSTSHGQDTKPTKQQTMSWIAGKMEKYLDSDNGTRFFVSYNNGVFKYKRYINANDGRGCGYTYVSIYLDRITSFNYCSIAGKGLAITDISKNYYCTDLETETKDCLVLRSGCKFEYRCDELNPVYLFNFDLEDGLFSRLSKAFNELVLYNVGGQKEPY